MKIHFSKEELKDLGKAWVAITIAFALVLSGRKMEAIPSFMLVSAIAVGFGFLLHELGHKFVAQHYGCFAEFRSFDFMLVLAFIMSFFGFVFAAPGAVMIRGHIDNERNGKISVAGPLINLLMAVGFLIVSFSTEGFVQMISSYGFFINSFLALFNLIPFGNFDGAKVYRWNKPVWWSMVIVSFIFTFKVASLSG
ncbi:MAG: site-2 protease family protein [Nanoarchaeota archaeon]|nr:site-2 protease family protein [Nanoarchaeota archaeon]